MIYRIFGTLIGIVLQVLAVTVLVISFRNAAAWNDGTPVIGGFIAFFMMSFFAWGFIASANQKDW